MASFILPIISGLTGLFGGGSKKTTQTDSNTASTSTQSGNATGTTTPNLSPLQQQLAQMFGNQAINLANHNADLSGYTNQGLKDINTGSNLASKTIANNLASRGLSFSPAAATQQTGQELNRIGQSQSFLSQIPLLQRQLQQQNISGLEGAFGVLPTGVSTTGTSNLTGTNIGQSSSTQTQSTPGGLLNGLFSGLGAGLAAPGTGGNSNLSNILNQFGFGGKGGSSIGGIPSDDAGYG